MSTIEIQTIHRPPIEWVAIMHASHDEDAIRWAEKLLVGFRDGKLKPNLRIVDNAGKVVGAWQDEGYEPDHN